MPDIDKLIDEIEAGLHGTTRGEWAADNELPYGKRPRVHSNSNGRLIAEVGNAEVDRQDAWEADAAHIARCNPDNMQAIITAYREMKAELSEARKQLESTVFVKELDMKGGGDED